MQGDRETEENNQIIVWHLLCIAEWIASASWCADFNNIELTLATTPYIRPPFDLRTFVAEFACLNNYYVFTLFCYNNAKKNVGPTYAEIVQLYWF